MKRLLFSTALTVALALTCVTAQEHKQDKHASKHDAAKHDQHKKDEHKKEEHKAGHHAAAPADQTADVTLAAGEVVKRGAALGTSEAVKLSDVLTEPHKFAGKTVIIEGAVERVCQKQGCWMELVPEKGARGVRITFGEHAFFVPFNSAGLRARAEGRVAVKTLTKEEADHLEGDGGKLHRDKDGQASEISFVATGLELKK